MTPTKTLVIDANILLRGVLGHRVRNLLRSEAYSVTFCTPETCFEEARRTLPGIVARRKWDLVDSLAVLDEITQIVQTVERSSYEHYQAEARRRRIFRDVSDWPVVATALLLDCPVWTEDQDFFGSGLPIWTTNNVEIYLKAAI